MIHGFETWHPLEPEQKAGLQWSAAIGAGLVAGVVLLLLPRGSPWAVLTFFQPVVMGRLIPEYWGMALGGTILIHLGLSLIYGVILSRVVVPFRELAALLGGGVVGLVLYLVNVAVVSLWIPQWRGIEFSVMFTHLVFGLIAGGAYRGLLRRKASTG